MSVVKSDFGKTKSGEAISLYTIDNGKMKASVTDFGANVVNLFVPNDKGEVKDIVHGFDKVEDYFDNPCFFGACIGRSANRIANAKFSIDGTEYALKVNDNENNLHSDADNGFHKKLWKAEIVDAENKVVFSYHSPDMENGFPGNMDVKVSYSLSDDCGFKIEYEALSDKKTLFNPTNHSYFNLGGHDSGSMEDTLLQLKSLGLQEIKTAFDMDYVSNYHVQAGYSNLHDLLDDLDLAYSTYLWNPRFKGLDDYIWEHMLRKKRET